MHLILRLYSWLKWTSLAEVYRYIKSSDYRQSIKHEYSLLRQLICRDLLIFDIGANQGSKTAGFLRLGAKRVVAVEPDFKCAEVLKCRFYGNKKVTLVFAAIDKQCGRATLRMINEGNAYNTLSNKWVSTLESSSKTRFDSIQSFDISKEVNTVTIDYLCTQYGVPDVIKIDVEGFEWNAIQGLSRGIKLLWFEANLPEFLEEVINCIIPFSGRGGISLAFRRSLPG